MPISGLPPDVYLDDVVPGFSYRSPEHTVTQSDVDSFAELTRDRTRIHTDPAFAATRPYGRTLAHGAFALSLMIGLKSELKLFQNSSVAALGWEQVRYHRPMFPGDTVYARVTFAAKRLSRTNPGRGVLRERIELVNQDEQVVASGDHLIMLETRPSGSPTDRSAA